MHENQEQYHLMMMSNSLELGGCGEDVAYKLLPSKQVVASIVVTV